MPPSRKIPPSDPWIREAITKRPQTISQYRWNRFIAKFANGFEFWTQQDGARELVICRRPDAVHILMDKFPSRWEEPILNHYLRLMWVSYVIPSFRRQASVWTIGEDETPFPVLVWDPLDHRRRRT